MLREKNEGKDGKDIRGTCFSNAAAQHWNVRL
jgi:hypothetical protein